MSDMTPATTPVPNSDAATAADATDAAASDTTAAAEHLAAREDSQLVVQLGRINEALDVFARAARHFGGIDPAGEGDLAFRRGVDADLVGIQGRVLIKCGLHLI